MVEVDVISGEGTEQSGEKTKVGKFARGGARSLRERST